MSKYPHYSKWPRYYKEYTEWWEGLTIDERVCAKLHFCKLSSENIKRKYPYPEMPDLSHLRISQLTNKHICRMWTFKDHKTLL